MINDKLIVKGKYYFEIKRVDGSIERWSEDNLIVSAGKAQLALLAGDASATPFTYIAVGSSSTAVAIGQTALSAEIAASGLTRASASVSRTTTTVTNDTLTLSKTFTATGSVTVEEVGVFNDSSAGTMLGRALTTTKSLVDTETLTIIYNVVFA